MALNACLNTIGRTRRIDELMPADIQQLRVDLIATRSVATVNNYLATFMGFLRWCEDNEYCEGLAKHCTRFTKIRKEPDPPHSLVSRVRQIAAWLTLASSSAQALSSSSKASASPTITSSASMAA